MKAAGTLGYLDWCSLSSPSRNYCTCGENPQIGLVKQQAFWKMNRNASLNGGGKKKKKYAGEEVGQLASQHEIIPSKKIPGSLKQVLLVKNKDFTHPHRVQMSAHSEK